MRAIRYLILTALGAVILWATLQSFVPGNENLRLLAGALLAVAGLIQSLEWLYDRLGPARDLRRKAAERPSQPGTVEEYLDGWLRGDDALKQINRISFIPLTVAVTAEYQQGDAPPTENLLQILKDNPRGFVLVGDPGAGKSLSLRELMRKQIEQYRSIPQQEPRFPVWINLGEGANPIDVEGEEGLLQHWWGKRCYLPDTPERAIRQHQFMLLLDGLNEMPLDSREKRAKALREFAERNPTLTLVVTCRVRDYEDDAALNLPLPVVKVLPLDDDRIQQFIERNGGDGKLWAAIQADEALRSLAANPYNLYQLIQVYRDPRRKGTTEALPRDLNQLYSAYLERVYEDYTDKRKSLNDPLIPLLRLPWRTLKKRLQRLAFAMLAEGKGTSAEVEWALHWRRRWRWGGQAIRDGLNLGVLLGDGENLRFYHQSLHGYFAIEPLSRALAVKGFRRFVNNPANLIRQIGDLGAAGAPAVEALVFSLSHSDREIRISSVRSLGEIGDTRAVDPLIKLLADFDHEIRLQTTTSLAWIRDVRAVEPLIERLTDINSEVRWMATAALGQMGERALTGLLEQVAHADGLVRKHISSALGQTQDTRAISALIDRLADPDTEVRVHAAAALASIGEAAVDGLIKRLAGLDFESSKFCYGALICIGEPAVKALIERLGDPDRDVRMFSFAALVLIKEPAVESLIARLGDPDRSVCELAAGALGYIGEAAVGSLTERLKDPNGNGRMMAAAALVKIGEPAVQPLIEMLDVPDCDAHILAILALIGSPAVQALVNRVADPNESLRRNVAEALALIGEPAIQPLIRMLTDSDARNRLCSSAVLIRIGEPAVQPIIANLNPESPYSLHSIAALSQIGEPAVRPLFECLVHSSEQVRYLAAATLVIIGNPVVIPLIERLTDSSCEIRIVAAAALAYIEDDRAVRPLIGLLADDDKEVRDTASLALERIGTAEALAAVKAWRGG